VLPREATEPPPILVFHKPKGVIVARVDERGAKTVYDLLPPWVRSDGWIPVGRLDKDSRGLLLFVRDGKLMDALSRPGAHEKVYEVWVRGRVTQAHADAIMRGVPTPLGVMHASNIELKGGVGPKSRVLVTLAEGRNRQVRRLFAPLKDEHDRALKVLELKRISFGPLTLDIPSGHWRRLTEAEVARLTLPA
jgi:23S rRNA pseudouridine2605 synthase